MPNGAIISPPDTSSDEEPEVPGKSRGTLIADAVSKIQPNTSNGEDASTPSQKPEGLRLSHSTTSLDSLRRGHTRSATEPNISFSTSTSTNSPSTGSEEDSEGEKRPKTPMVRKKSGELVRPALRTPGRRRPSSAPGTPTFAKAVHFDSHLEHVRHFLQLDRPLAVSAGSSPVDSYDSDTEYPFDREKESSSRSQSYEWELVLTNFPADTSARRWQPVRLERVWLSNDQKCLVGSVAVGNFAFQKQVACRFTLDYWKTTSEVAADYLCEIRPVETPHSQDRFQFSIQLSDLVNLESKTLYFCIRYSVNGQEYWDNNNGKNFQVDFRKKSLHRDSKKSMGSRGFTDLPKSSRRGTLPTSSRSKKTVDSDNDDFSESVKLNFSQTIREYLGEEPEPKGPRLKGVRSSNELVSDNLSIRLSGPSGQLSTRYDFSSSLSRAIKSAKEAKSAPPSDGLYMKSSKKMGPATFDEGDKDNKPQPSTTNEGSKNSAASVLGTSSSSDTPKPSIASASYEEILSKWCFYSTKSKITQPRVSASDSSVRSPTSSNTGSYGGSPVQTGNYYHNFGEIGASPAEAPLSSFPTHPTGSPVGGAMQNNFIPLTAI